MAKNSNGKAFGTSSFRGAPVIASLRKQPAKKATGGDVGGSKKRFSPSRNKMGSTVRNSGNPKAYGGGSTIESPKRRANR